MLRYTLIILLVSACRPSSEKIDKTTDDQDSGAGQSETYHAATPENVNDAVVVRDAAGNFSATTISANLEGNASSASVAETALNLSATLTVAKGGTGATTAADARTNLGLGSIATQNANSVSISGGAISGVSFSSKGITDAASSTLLNLTSGGNVGIGTASPGEKLTVAGTIESTSGGFKFPAGDVQLRAATAVPHILLCHEEATGVAGGGSTTGGQWNLRPVNVEKRDVYNLVSLSSNQITIAAGSYYCQIVAQAESGGGSQLRIRNVTDNTTLALGHSGFNDMGGPTVTIQLQDLFSIASQKVIQIEQFDEWGSDPAQGLGQASSSGETERFMTVACWKID